MHWGRGFVASYLNHVQHSHSIDTQSPVGECGVVNIPAAFSIGEGSCNSVILSMLRLEPDIEIPREINWLGLGNFINVFL